jgi:hypothetical protein
VYRLVFGGVNSREFSGEKSLQFSGVLWREISAVHASSTQSTAHSHSTIKCNLSVTITKKFSLKMTQQGRNM